MSKRQVLMILGVLVIIVPHLGFPDDNWDAVILGILGVLVIAVAYKIGPAAAPADRSEEKPFVDHHNPGSSAPTS